MKRSVGPISFLVIDTLESITFLFISCNYVLFCLMFLMSAFYNRHCFNILLTLGIFIGRRKKILSFAIDTRDVDKIDDQAIPYVKILIYSFSWYGL